VSGQTVYTYVGNDPLDRIDPTGTDFRDVIEQQAPELVAIGDAFAGDAAFVVGKLTGNEGLVNAAAEGLSAAKSTNVQMAAMLLTTTRGGGEEGGLSVGRGPRPNNGVGPAHGAADHNAAIEGSIGKLKSDPGVTNIRKNQAQVDVNGNKVGNNRPDVQYDKNSAHHAQEFDRSGSKGDAHRETIQKNDPQVVCSTITLRCK